MIVCLSAFRRLAALCPSWVLVLVALTPCPAQPADETFDRFGEIAAFDDAPVEDRPNPDWFKLSFLDLREDLAEAVEEGKSGIIVYFGQKQCAYCKAMIEANFGKKDIVEYTRTHFDVIPIDIWGDRTVTDLDGQVLSEREYAVREKTNFTPSLIFYGANGTDALRLRGYHPPYQFRAALEYVAGGHAQLESFRDYLARGEHALVFEEGDLNEDPLLMPPPHMLDRSWRAADKPLIVLFERGSCHACDVLHGIPLQHADIRSRLARFNLTQLDMWSAMPVVTPAGERLTASDWAERLGIFYAPTLVFFDEFGGEIFRVDSVIMFYRLRAVLDYILEEGYLEEPNFQRWREKVHNPSTALTSAIAGGE